MHVMYEKKNPCENLFFFIALKSNCKPLPPLFLRLVCAKVVRKQTAGCLSARLLSRLSSIRSDGSAEPAVHTHIHCCRSLTEGSLTVGVLLFDTIEGWDSGQVSKWRSQHGWTRTDNFGHLGLVCRLPSSSNITCPEYYLIDTVSDEFVG